MTIKDKDKDIVKLCLLAGAANISPKLQVKALMLLIRKNYTSAEVDSLFQECIDSLK